MATIPFANASHDFGAAGPTSRPGPAPTSPEPQQHPASPVNPDPKSHPIHPSVPVQPIHEGTDPKQPVMPGAR